MGQWLSDCMVALAGQFCVFSWESVLDTQLRARSSISHSLSALNPLIHGLMPLSAYASQRGFHGLQMNSDTMGKVEVWHSNFLIFQ